ncbi:SidA/IucD/PvdA family monooxygenase [Mycobacterium tuberculosis]|nr:SidA/IucD/PvdA family monooxygenase [Mycobacterium tuberculosis]
MNQHFDVLIIGAGLSGIGTACHVTAEFPDKTIALLERRERLGGTWDLFRYPGVRSDSDMFTFGYKFRPWRDVKVLADGASIRQYIADTATEFGVDEKIHYGLKVNTAEWSSRQCRWTVAGVHEATGETRTYTCDYLISCTGYYNYDAGYLPDFPGVHRFGGRCVHPQHWPEDLDYSGKKVVVIGSGATAVTLVPAMAGSNPGSAAHVTMLQRSPSYIFSLPAVDKISEVLGRFLPDRWVYEFGRRRNIAIQRKLYQACRRWPKLMRRLLLWEVRRRLGRSVDMSNFTPNYLPWDERLCAVPNGDLFKTLASGAASVVTDQIETFTEKGILCKSGREIEADIIVTATGLNIQMLGGMRLIVDGAEYQLPEKMTYKGVLLENAPNLAWIIGYTNASWTLKSDIAGAYLVLAGRPAGREHRRAWEQLITPRSMHVVRREFVADDLRVLATRIAGRSVGLVLSGGAARACAHLGVLEELEAAGVTVDRFAGTSMGAIIAALAASGLDAAGVDAQIYEHFVRKSHGDYTLPSKGLIRGKRTQSTLRTIFGDHLVEELPKHFRCVSVDLLARRPVVHRQGPLADVVGCSMRLPFLYAPLPYGGTLHVDGGVLDNVPVTTLVGKDGPLIAVNVASGGNPSPASGGHRRGKPRVPGLTDTLLRTMTISSAMASEKVLAQADLVIKPNPIGVGLMEYHQIDRAREAGRIAAREALPQIMELVHG